MSSRGSTSVEIHLELLEKTSPSSDWDFGTIWTSWKTSSIRFANTSLISLSGRCVCPPLAQYRAFIRLHSFHHGLMAGVFFASQLYRSAIPSRNSVFVRPKPCFDNESALGQIDAPFSETSWIYFISRRLFSIQDFTRWFHVACLLFSVTDLGLFYFTLLNFERIIIEWRQWTWEFNWLLKNFMKILWEGDVKPTHSEDLFPLGLFLCRRCWVWLGQAAPPPCPEPRPWRV